MKLFARLVVVLTTMALAIAGMSVSVAAAESAAKPGGGDKQVSGALPTLGGGKVQHIAPPQGVKSANYSADESWWGTTYKFNGRETSTIAAGAASCAGYVGRIPGFGWVLAAACGSLSTYAGWLRSRGQCLMARVTRVAPATVWWGWDC